MQQSPKTVAIFCSVVDNFGDIGICWRLSRQLQAYTNWTILLFVDDLSSFQKICPQIKLDQVQQQQQGVTVLHWQQALQWPEQLVPDLCIEALACQIPQPYLRWLAQVNPAAIWLNLEYLSAENWVEGCHGLASPQSEVALQKYFFFPGFTAATGGLLREAGIVSQLQQFQVDNVAMDVFWQQIGVNNPEQYALKISLFAYGQRQIQLWLKQLSRHPAPVLLLIPEGVLAQQIRQLYPAVADNCAEWIDQQLSLRILPFMPQQQYDLLLAAADFNFVRGEDSVIRAHWAGKPFIWQIYRQQQDAHQVKLQAFLQLMLKNAPENLQQLILQMHQLWDNEQDFRVVWPQILENYQQLRQFTLQWQQELMQQQDLASNLVRFAENKFIMPRNFS